MANASPGTPAGQPRTWLVPAVIVTLLCNVLGGAVALFFAALVRQRAAAGDLEGARRASTFALVACVASVPLGLFNACGGFGIQWLRDGGWL